MKYLFPKRKAKGRLRKSEPVRRSLFFVDKFDDGIERGDRRRLLSTRELAAELTVAIVTRTRS